MPPRTVVRPGSDLMVDALKSVGIEFVMANPGSSFEGLQESIINYGQHDIEFITALHEESAVAAAHGELRKDTGKPMATLLHGTIGVQHAAMAIYNAYVDRVPIVMIAGLDYDGPVAAHNATDMGAIVRGFTKWDAQPRTLTDAIAAIQRAYAVAVTPPTAPVMVTLTGAIQKEETAGSRVSVPPYRPPQMLAADSWRRSGLPGRWSRRATRESTSAGCARRPASRRRSSWSSSSARRPAAVPRTVR
jgi:thiamine pyrophosphate-dependent acetolactate synthase large subunit-like protein